MLRGACCALLAAAAASAGPPAVGNATAGVNVQIGGHPCRVYYPNGDGPFPAVPWFHGFGSSGGTGYERIMGRLAKEGFIGILVTDCAMGCGGVPGGEWASKWANDVVTGVPKAGLKKFNGVIGIAGHSMGGAVCCDYSQTYGKTSPVKGIAMVHEGLCSTYKLEQMTIPAVFITGTKDTISNDKTLVLANYKKYAATQKVYADVDGDTHFAINDGGAGKEDAIVVLIMKCFLNADGEACDTVWTGLDKVGGFKLAGYEHVGAPPHSGPTPPTPPAAPRYHCDAATHACSEASTGHGTLAKCEAACAAPAPTPPAPPAPGGDAYACVVKEGSRACQPVAAGFPGSYPTLAQCTAVCVAN